MAQAAALASVGQRYGLAGPFRYVFIAVTAMIIGWYWLSRQAPFRWAAQRRGWRLALAVLSSLGMLTFGISFALGRQAIWIAALIVSGVPAMILVVESSRSEGRPQPPSGPAG